MTKPFDYTESLKIDAYLDGTLAADERDQFAREIDGNGQLRADIELQSRIDESLARLFAPPQVPANLHERLRPLATATRVAIGGRGRWLKMAALAAAATVVWAMLGWHFFASRT